MHDETVSARDLRAGLRSELPLRNSLTSKSTLMLCNSDQLIKSPEVQETTIHPVFFHCSFRGRKRQ
jgi:hypothetical protein